MALKIPAPRAEYSLTESALSPFQAEPGHRLQSEHWLEALLVRDITRVDPTLWQDFVYPQVPAFTGQDRGVIDLLGVTARGRLAVIEIKLDEDINLPLQGLDYWASRAVAAGARAIAGVWVFPQCPALPRAAASLSCLACFSVSFLLRSAIAIPRAVNRSNQSGSESAVAKRSASSVPACRAAIPRE